MSGNTTRLGVDLATNPMAAAIPAGLIAGFVLGVILGALVAERWPARRKSAVLLLVVALLGLSAVARMLSVEVFLGASVIAMGALNNVFRRNGEVAIGITYMTGALVRFGQGVADRLMGRTSEGRLGAGALWFGLAAGSVMGALAFTRFPQQTPFIAALFAAAMLIVANRIERRASQASI